MGIPILHYQEAITIDQLADLTPPTLYARVSSDR